MEKENDVLVYASEILKDRLYFVTIQSKSNLKSTPNSYYFSVDDEVLYENFYADFGPYNLSVLYRYCEKLKKKLSAYSLSHKKIFHYTTKDPKKRVNAAFLIGSYAIIYLKQNPNQVYNTLLGTEGPHFIDFRDASRGAPRYHLSLLDCLLAVSKAHQLGFFDFEDFDNQEYEYYERVENGDLSWIVPHKFIAFCGPQARSKIENGYPIHSPESYFPYFRRNNVTTIVRLNRKKYDAHQFSNAGFEHRDLFFIDGTCPNNYILQAFLTIAENAQGAVAVHCKAGLGRTGSLIGCYIMKHYRMTAMEAIAWIRLCRPGSIIGHQQQWLQEKEQLMWDQGDLHRIEHGPTPRPSHGVYSLVRNNNVASSSPKGDTVLRILKKVDTMRIDGSTNDLLNKNYRDSEETTVKPLASGTMTQGDKLNQIKVQRQNLHSRGTASPASTSVVLSGRPHTRAMSQLLKSTDGSLASNQCPLRSPKAVSAMHSWNTAAKRTSRLMLTSAKTTRTGTVTTHKSAIVR